MAEPIVVLVVEDEALLRMDTADVLTDAGFEVLEAANADEAIIALEADPRIRLVFTDVDMPGTMDGLRLARVVADRWPPVRIIITSGHRLVEITDIPDGSLFFAKPYQHKVVIGSIREALRS
jgi:two-component system, response regulator PdtaR